MMIELRGTAVPMPILAPSARPAREGVAVLDGVPVLETGVRVLEATVLEFLVTLVPTPLL